MQKRAHRWLQQLALVERLSILIHKEIVSGEQECIHKYICRQNKVRPSNKLVRCEKLGLRCTPRCRQKPSAGEGLVVPAGRNSSSGTNIS